jgi:hypothetical protein
MADAGRNPYAVAVGDFNGDGLADLAVADNAIYGGSPGVSVLLGKGTGRFQSAHLYAAGTHPASVAVGDFNADGRQDLAVVGWSGTHVLLGDGHGGFPSAPGGRLPVNLNFVTGYSTGVAVGDFNGDGRPDLAVANPWWSAAFILANDGTWHGSEPGAHSPTGSAGPPSALRARLRLTGDVFKAEVWAASGIRLDSAPAGGVFHKASQPLPTTSALPER